MFNINRRGVTASWLGGLMGIILLAGGATATADQAYIAFPRQGDLNTWERLTFVCLQGIANRERPRLFLKMQHRDPLYRKWYEKHYGVRFTEVKDAYQLFEKAAWPIKGYVLVDPKAPATANLGANYASIANLLPVTKPMLEQHPELPDLPVKHDLRKRFRDKSRVAVARWAAKNQFPRTSGEVIVNLSGPREEIGGLFKMHNVRDYGVARRGFFTYLSSDPRDAKEQALKGRLLKQLRPLGYVMGWHAAHARGERWHVRQASQNGLIVLCSTTSSNFSFHRHIEAKAPLRPPHNATPSEVTLKQDKVYVTFVYSDGDSLNWFSRAQGHQWMKQARGQVILGWEVQPLLAKIAPAMLEYFYRTARPKDRFVASASGIGYTYPDTMPAGDLRRLLTRSRAYLKRTGLHTLTVLPFEGVGDRKAQLYERLLGEQLYGVMEGYWVKKQRERRHMTNLSWTPIVLPSVNTEKANSPQGLAKRLRNLAEKKNQRPLFLPVHLPAHRVKYKELVQLSEKLDPDTFEIVGPDAFYIALRRAQASR